MNRFEYSKINQFSNRDISYAMNPEIFQELLPYSPNLDGLQSSLNDRKNSRQVDRQLLVQVLRDQYGDIESGNQMFHKIDLLLNDNCYTVSTAHQPVIFLGPLYVIYKAISAIKIAEECNAKDPINTVVPIFVVGGEDHDFEEIRSTKIFGKTYSWDEAHHNGSVGELNPQTLKPLIAEIKSIFQNDPKGSEYLDIINLAYSNHTSFTRASQEILNKLLGKYGLLTIDLSDRRLKASFKNIILEEVLNHSAQGLVKTDQDIIHDLGFADQAYAREINFFLKTKDNQRSRIIPKQGANYIELSNETYEESEIRQIILEEPERLSPNVVMRPLYQAHCLPDIAYVGGGGELAYWMERPSLFKHYDKHFPVLLRRSSLILMPENLWNIWTDLDLNLSDLLLTTDAVKKKAILENHTIDLSNVNQHLNEAFSDLTDLAIAIDPNLEKSIGAMKAQTLKNIDKIEQKLLRNLKKNDEVSMSKIDKIKAECNPDTSLQERSENFLSYYSQHSGDLIQLLYENIRPLPSKIEIMII